MLLNAGLRELGVEGLLHVFLRVVERFRVSNSRVWGNLG